MLKFRGTTHGPSPPGTNQMLFQSSWKSSTYLTCFFNKHFNPWCHSGMTFPQIFMIPARPNCAGYSHSHYQKPQPSQLYTSRNGTSGIRWRRWLTCGSHAVWEDKLLESIQQEEMSMQRACKKFQLRINKFLCLSCPQVGPGWWKA